MAELVPTSRLNQDVMESLPQEVIDGQLSWELSRKAPLVCQQCACLKTRGKVKQKGEKHNGKERARESEREGGLHHQHGRVGVRINPACACSAGCVSCVVHMLSWKQVLSVSEEVRGQGASGTWLRAVLRGRQNKSIPERSFCPSSSQTGQCLRLAPRWLRSSLSLVLKCVFLTPSGCWLICWCQCVCALACLVLYQNVYVNAQCVCVS